MLSERIPYYILDLLQLTPSVYVEGLGRFEAIFHSAKIDLSTSKISPPHIVGAFKADEEQPNETLEAFIRYTSGEDIESPKTAIADFVKTVLKETKDGSPYVIDKFGVFVKSDQGNLRFTPDWDAFNISFNGLESVELKPVRAAHADFVPLVPPTPYVPKVIAPDPEAITSTEEDATVAAAGMATVEKTREAFEKDLEKIDPSNSKLWWIMLTSAIVLIAILCAYLTWDIMTNQKRLNELRQARLNTTLTTPIIKDPNNQLDSTAQNVPSTNTPGDSSNTETPQQPIDEGVTPCYIVVGAFGDPINVSKMVDRLKAMNYTVEELRGRTLTKVAISTSCDQQNLQRVLDEVRSSINPEAWIY